MSASGLEAVWQEELPDVAAIGFTEHGGAARIANKLRRALDHPVPFSGLLHLDLTGGRELEALLGAALGLDLGHFALS